METQGWQLCNKYDLVFYQIKKFNSTYYKIEIMVDLSTKTAKAWVALSSGRKRKDLDNFEPDDKTRDGGLKALMWVKSEVLNFYEYFNEKYRCELYNKLYICIHWSDNKRRNVYSRLKKEGFYFMKDNNTKILMKEIKIKN